MADRNSMGPGMSNAAAQFNNVFSSFQRSLAPLGEQVGKQWVQVQQLAKERFSGNTADVTELPPEYRALEEKVDRSKQVYELLLKVSKNYTLHAYDYEPAMNDKVLDFANTVSTGASSFAERLASSAGGAQNASPRHAPHPETPPSLSHAFAKAAYISAELVGSNEPYGAALKKFAAAEERAGNMRLRQDQDAVAKFHNIFLLGMNKVNEAMKSRRNVQSARLTYDASRSRLKSAPADRAGALRTEMEKAEDEFVLAVDESMGKMKLVIENTQPLRALADLVSIQLQYHKAVQEVLSELGPEIDELVVTSDALYNAPH